jgi:hypothetical protein
VSVTLVAEFCVLAAFSVGWELTGGRPGSTAQVLLIAALAVAMGIQSAAVRQLGGMSTTYLTGTLTAVVTELVTRDRGPGFARSVGCWPPSCRGPPSAAWSQSTPRLAAGRHHDAAGGGRDRLDHRVRRG